MEVPMGSRWSEWIVQKFASNREIVVVEDIGNNRDSIWGAVKTFVWTHHLHLIVSGAVIIIVVVAIIIIAIAIVVGIAIVVTAIVVIVIAIIAIVVIGVVIVGIVAVGGVVIVRIRG